jgi:hypothetical protein
LRKEMTMAIPGMKVAGVLPSILMVVAPLAIVGLVPGAIGNAVGLPPKPITVTECLQKGTAKNEFILTTKDGKKYEVASTALALAGHVGHTVTIKGNSMKSGDLKATSLTMVSTTCS